jgi:penicillin-insensitive murein endopeptidase
MASVLVTLFSLGLLVTGTASAAETRWSRVDSVASGRAETIGGPSNGCLRGAQALAPSGDGFVSIRRHRNRYYGHPETIAFVQEVAETVRDQTGGRLIMVGDLAQPRGGRMASSHVSHQNGLDVDVWLSVAESPRQAWNDTPEARDPPSMVAANGLEPSHRWGPTQRLLIKTAATHPAVDRILVNPVIKRALCRSEGSAAWLRKLRPWWGHDAHMHVRLKCPSGSPDCQQQAPVPAGSGCGSQLAWWFSDEARSPKRASSSPRQRPQPPAACEVVLRAP